MSRKKLYESYLWEANADKAKGNYIENFYFHMRSFGLTAVEKEKLRRKVARNSMSWKEHFFKAARSGGSRVINFIIFFAPVLNILLKIPLRNFFWSERQFASLELHCSSQAASSIIQLTSSVNIPVCFCMWCAHKIGKFPTLRWDGQSDLFPSINAAIKRGLLANSST